VLSDNNNIIFLLPDRLSVAINNLQASWYSQFFGGLLLNVPSLNKNVNIYLQNKINLSLKQYRYGG
jgi:hypothetical protein